MIRIRDLKKVYDSGSRYASEVLHGISLELPDKGFICITGASGSGKTSLLNAVGGLDDFQGGSLEILGQEILSASSPKMEEARNASFGYIFQNYYLLASHSCAYNVYLGLHSMDISEEEKMRRVRDALDRVGMLRYRKRRVGDLSGGQQQRVAIARAIAKRPAVIFADEPTGNLDEANTMNICSILKELSADRLVVMVTHETRIAEHFADRIISIEDGRISSDSTDWEQSGLALDDKNTIYTGDYAEENAQTDGARIRVLAKDGVQPAELTVLVEDDRIIIKAPEGRMLLCASPSEAPYITEGSRPSAASAVKDVPKDTDDLPGRDWTELSWDAADDRTAADAADVKPAKNSGLGASMILREAKALASGKKLRRIGTCVFLILLSVMLCVAAADYTTVSRIDPEDFITTDSHVLSAEVGRGPEFSDKYVWSLQDYVNEIIEEVRASGQDADFIPKLSGKICFYDQTMPQFKHLSLDLKNYSLVDISRLDPDDLILGRMPEVSGEIVVDRWVIDKCLSGNGIIQNLIPGREYLLNKRVYCERRWGALTIVGISDSGQPALYADKPTMMACGVYGVDAVTLSEFRRVTGRTDVPDLAAGEIIILADNAGGGYMDRAGTAIDFPCGQSYRVKTVLKDTPGIAASYVIADEALDDLYQAMISSVKSFDIWCGDKDAVTEIIKEKVSGVKNGSIRAELTDRYADAYKEYADKVSVKLDARTIITAAVVILCAVMLYLLQRSAIRENMDLIVVYRLLGIPKRDLVAVFLLESLIHTLKYALPVTVLTWAALYVMSAAGLLDTAVYFPVWAAALCFMFIAVIRMLVSVIPVLRLLREMPAKLAARYDF